MASRQKAQEELFFQQRNGNGEDSPTIEPLRINKPASPSPPRTGSASSSKYNYSPPTKHVFPLPPGASSSAAPLPYPDEDTGTFNFPAPPESAQPVPDRSQQESPLYASQPQPSSRPAAQNRKGSYDTGPRIGTSPVEQTGSRLAERRGVAPRPLPGTASPQKTENDALFAREPQRPRQNGRRPSEPSLDQHPAFQQQSNSIDSTSMPAALIAPKPMNRFASTASTSTVRASRGSPAPPETPVELPGGGIEARFAAAGIAGPATLSSLQAQNAAAALRQNQYAPPPVPQLPNSPGLYPGYPQSAPRPWTPSEIPSQQTHGPPAMYQGATQLGGGLASPGMPQPSRQGSMITHANNTLEQDFQRIQLSASPPPAYSDVGGSAAASGGYPNEKQQAVVNKAEIPHPLASPALQHPGHPAFANEQGHQTIAGAGPMSPGLMSSGHAQTGFPVSQFATAPGGYDSVGTGTLASPPPLPEGWISHLDTNSGQYYYIHLATQATQWEFPKGPTPLNMHDPTPLSPTASTYGNPLASPALSTFHGKFGQASPMFPPHTPGYAESIMSFTSATPTTGFTGPPPSAGVDMYKIAPTNGVYFGPYLKYINMDLERGIWLGCIMLITDGSQPPTIHIHLSHDLSPNPRQLKANPIYTHQRWTFYRYDIDLQMSEGTGDKWTYAVTSHLGCTRYEFLVAGRYETNWRFIAHSGNDFAMNTNQNERANLGGVGFMWKDILQKNVDCGGFHVQLGLGDQIYADRMWKEIPLLKQWLAISGKDNRKNSPWTAKHEEDVTHAVFHYYTSHFDQPYLREAFAQIPHVLQLDDHDIFDGFGSYPPHMQNSHMFRNIGRIGIEMFLLFQHHTTIELLRNVSNDVDLFTITNIGWHFVKYLGPAVVVVGPDIRSERTQTQVMAGPTYQGLFPKVATLPPSVQHCVWMIAVPLIYPRLDAVESFANTVQTGKKVVNTGYNIVGKVAGGLAGVVGGREVVQSGFSQVKKAVGKSGLMGGVLNTFGDVEMADEIRDMWTHESKDVERTYLIRTLQGIAHQKGIRMTFLSGQVNCCGAGLVHDPSHPSDHKTMYQIISSSVVAAPPSNYVLKMLHNNKPLYVPQNGHKSTHQVSDTKEDMMEIFQMDTNGAPRELKKLMGRRNYVAFVAYDPAEVPGMGSGVGGHEMYAKSQHSGEQGLSKLNLAVDFVVQGDGQMMPTKYGPVIIPNLEFGR